MNIISYLVITIVALLSIAAGLAKVLQTPQEMEFLQGAGLSTGLIIVFGIVQILGGLLLAPGKTRMVGAVIAAAAFAVSAALIFVSGNLVFGLVSPLCLAVPPLPFVLPLPPPARSLALPIRIESPSLLVNEAVPESSVSGLGQRSS